MIDPEVDPAEPPTNISANSVSSATAGQRAKSALAMPVVVTIDTVWKKAERTASSPVAIPSPQSITVSATVATRSRPR